MTVLERTIIDLLTMSCLISFSCGKFPEYTQYLVQILYMYVYLFLCLVFHFCLHTAFHVRTLFIKSLTFSLFLRVLNSMYGCRLSSYKIAEVFLPYIQRRIRILQQQLYKKVSVFRPTFPGMYNGTCNIFKSTFHVISH
jgi:hypothetical protein